MYLASANSIGLLYTFAMNTKDSVCERFVPIPNVLSLVIGLTYMSWISWKYQKMIQIAEYMGYERKYVYI